MLLGYNVAKAPGSPRNLTWFTRPFLLVRGWGLWTRLERERLFFVSNIRQVLGCLWLIIVSINKGEEQLGLSYHASDVNIYFGRQSGMDAQIKLYLSHEL